MAQLLVWQSEFGGSDLDISSERRAIEPLSLPLTLGDAEDHREPLADDAPLLALAVEPPLALALVAPGGDAVVPHVRTLAVLFRDDSRTMLEHLVEKQAFLEHGLSLIHISEPTRLLSIAGLGVGV